MFRSLVFALVVFVFSGLSPNVFAETKSGSSEIESAEWIAERDLWFEKIKALVPTEAEYNRVKPYTKEQLSHMTLKALWREYLAVSLEDRYTPYPLIYEAVTEAATRENHTQYLKAIKILDLKGTMRGDISIDHSLVEPYFDDPDPFIAHLALAMTLNTDLFSKNANNLETYKNWSDRIERLTLTLPPSHHELSHDSLYIHFSVMGTFHGGMSQLERTYEVLLKKNKYVKLLGIHKTNVTDLINLVQNHSAKYVDAIAFSVFDDMLEWQNLNPRLKGQILTIRAIRNIFFADYDRALYFANEALNYHKSGSYWHRMTLQSLACVQAILGNREVSKDLSKQAFSDDSLFTMSDLSDLTLVNNLLPHDVSPTIRYEINSVIVKRFWNLRARKSRLISNFLTPADSHVMSKTHIPNWLSDRAFNQSLNYNLNLGPTSERLSLLDQQAYERIFSQIKDSHQKDIFRSNTDMDRADPLFFALKATLSNSALDASHEAIAFLKQTINESDYVLIDMLEVVANLPSGAIHPSLETKTRNNLMRLKTRLQTKLHKDVFELISANIAIRSAEYKEAWQKLDRLTHMPPDTTHVAVLNYANLLLLDLYGLENNLSAILKQVDTLLKSSNLNMIKLNIQDVVVPLIIVLEKNGQTSHAENLLKTVASLQLKNSGQIDPNFSYLHGKIILERGDSAEAIPLLNRALFQKRDKSLQINVLSYLYLAYAVEGEWEKVEHIETQLKTANQESIASSFEPEFYVNMERSSNKPSKDFTRQSSEEAIKVWGNRKVGQNYKDRMTERKVAQARLAMLEKKMNSNLQKEIHKTDSIRVLFERTKFLNIILIALSLIALFVLGCFGRFFYLIRKQNNALKSAVDVESYYRSHINASFLLSSRFVAKQLDYVSKSLTDVRAQEAIEISRSSLEDFAKQVRVLLICRDLELGGNSSLFQTVNISKMVEQNIERWRLATNGPGVKIYTHLSKKLPKFKSNPLLLQFMLDTMVKQSLEHTYHGSLTLKIYMDSNHGDHLVMDIKDTGDGLQDYFMEKQFGAFNDLLDTTIQSIGTEKESLGYLVPKIAEFLKGEFKCVSIPGNGTKVTVRIPIITMMYKRKYMNLKTTKAIYNKQKGVAANQP